VGKRLFIAVDIDAATREQVGRISSRVREQIASCAKASWVRPDRMHLTLQFFADADDGLEQSVRAALAHMPPQAAFNLTLEGLGCFPPRGLPRVLWLGVGDGVRELRRIHDDLERGVGVSAGHEESFTPHLTLARFRDRVPREKLAQIAEIRAYAGPSRIDRVTLYESRFSPASLDQGSGRPEAARRAGPTYLPLAHALLMT
jgi:RNA 2',3'-cyclic 3'-phosphodiesterase